MNGNYTLSVIDANHVDVIRANEKTIHITRSLAELELEANEDPEQKKFYQSIIDAMDIKKIADSDDIQWDEDSDEEEKERAEQHEEDNDQWSAEAERDELQQRCSHGETDTDELGEFCLQCGARF